MSEQEIKEHQINLLATQRTLARTVFNEDGIPVNYRDGFVDGATSQDQIATNRTVEAAIQIAEHLRDGEFDDTGYSALDRLIKELEKLKR